MRARSIRLPLATLTAFDRLYARIPAIECKGLCPDSCGMVPMTAFEWARLVAAHGKVPGPRLADETDGRNWCPFLKKTEIQGDKPSHSETAPPFLATCEHYETRPLLCRLWGVVDDPLMRCPHGCTVDRLLTRDEANELLREADRLGGGPTSAQMEIVRPDVFGNEAAGKNTSV